MAVSLTEILIIIFFVVIILFGTFVGIRYMIEGKICPMKRRRRSNQRRPRSNANQSSNPPNSRSAQGNGSPNEGPPTYEWVNEHSNSKTIAYIDSDGKVRYVKYDGEGPVPTHTPLGYFHDGMTKQFQRELMEIEILEENQESPNRSVHTE